MLNAEVWGAGFGPRLVSDMAGRNPDLVNEAFRNYAIDFGVGRVAEVFQEEEVPLTIALSALFPSQRPDAWKELRAAVPKAPIIAHGMNNSTDLLPMGGGLTKQENYIKQTLDRIEKDTGVRPQGWSSPTVYFNADTFRACAAGGIKYTVDAMDSDFLSLLQTPDGNLEMLPYPPVTVDMGQFITRQYKPQDMERLWIDYVEELAHEAEKHPSRSATVVAIGIHPFIVGTPDGAAALRRTLDALKKNQTVWLTDTETFVQAAGAKPE